MRQNWTPEELVRHFTIQADERDFLGHNAPHNQLGKAVLLKFFQYEARFPRTKNEIPQAVVTFIAHQLYVSPSALTDYQWDGRRIKEHRQAIRSWFGFRQASVDDQQAIQDWLLGEVLPDEHRPQHLKQAVYRRLRDQQLEPPTDAQVERLVTSVIHQYQQQFFQQTYDKLSLPVRGRLRQLLLEASIWQEQTAGYAPLHEMKLGAGAATVKHIQRVCDRLKGLQAIQLPEDLFDDLPLSYLRQYQRQVSVESPSHLLRRESTAPEQMYTLLAAFCWVRQRQVTDDLVDLFIRVLQNIRIKAEREEKKHLIADFIRVEGKQRLLFDLAEVMLNHPQGIIEEVLYPAMEDFELDLVIGEGPAARTVRIELQPFTLVGATTRMGLLTTPLRDRFGIPTRLQFYTEDELFTIVDRNAIKLGAPADEGGAREIARRARGTPRIAGRLLRRVVDFAVVEGDGRVTRELADAALTRLGVDHLGLDGADRRYLQLMADHYGGGPVGVETLSAALSESRDAREEVIEPYLLQQGLIQRTPRGRMLAARAWRQLGLEPPRREGDLFD